MKLPITRSVVYHELPVRKLSVARHEREVQSIGRPLQSVKPRAVDGTNRTMASRFVRRIAESGPIAGFLPGVGLPVDELPM